MDKKELQKAQNIIDVLFYDDKVLTQWQHTLLENVISIAQTKLRQPPVSGECEHPYHAVLGDGEMQPAKCLKCGKVL